MTDQEKAQVQYDLLQAMTNVLHHNKRKAAKKYFQRLAAKIKKHQRPVEIKYDGGNDAHFYPLDEEEQVVYTAPKE